MITLKALTYRPTGGIVAAPTTSLPEQIGGERNWDYRYCWLRDATLTLLGAMHAGYYEEAQAWREWLLRAVAGSPDQLQIMYGIGGERRLSEWTADWLPGYEKSTPVRIGNAAHTQLQLDVFGEVMDTYYQARRGGLTANESGWDATQVPRTSDQDLAYAGPGHLGNARTAAAIHLFQGHGLGCLRSGHQECGDIRAGRPARRLAQAARRDLRGGLRVRLRSRSSAPSCRLMDPISSTPICCICLASVFCRLTIRALKGPLRRSKRGLLRDGFVMRYSTDEVEDALPPGEGAFLACSFWLVDVYILQGRFDEAEALFRRLVGLCNDVGLLSEEYDPRLNRLVGNFPQAFSHLALINSAYNLTRRASRCISAPTTNAPPDGRSAGRVRRVRSAQQLEPPGLAARRCRRPRGSCCRRRRISGSVRPISACRH